MVISEKKSRKKSTSSAAIAQRITLKLKYPPQLSEVCMSKRVIVWQNSTFCWITLYKKLKRFDLVPLRTVWLLYWWRSYNCLKLCQQSEQLIRQQLIEGANDESLNRKFALRTSKIKQQPWKLDLLH